MKITLKIFKYSLIVFLSVIILFIFSIFLSGLFVSPSNERNWENDQKVLTRAEFHGDEVKIYNIRDFSYASTTAYTVNYLERTYDLSKLKKAWFVVSPFKGVPGSAHTFLSFEFEGNQYLSVSIEIRKELGESFHPLKGMFHQFEIMYVVATEDDVIKLRTNYRKDKVYLYPARASAEKTRALFVDILNRVNHLNKNPEFYNTVTNNCTSNIAAHINRISPNKFPWFTYEEVFPANSDKLAYDLGLIDTDLSFEEAREKYKINDRAMDNDSSVPFSLRIRN